MKVQLKRLPIETKIKMAQEYLTTKASLMTVAMKYGVTPATVTNTVNNYKAGKYTQGTPPDAA